MGLGSRYSPGPGPAAPGRDAPAWRGTSPGRLLPQWTRVLVGLPFAAAAAAAWKKRRRGPTVGLGRERYFSMSSRRDGASS